MNVKHHITFHLTPETHKLLTETGVKAVITPMSTTPDTYDYLVTLDVQEKDPRWKVFSSINNALDIRMIEYSKADLLKAQWLTVRSRTPTVDLARVDESFTITEPTSEGLARHKVKSGYLYLKQQPNWGKRHFLSTYSLGAYTLLCDDQARQFFNDNEMQVIFEPVLNAVSDEPIGNTFFLRPNYVLPLGAIHHNTSETKIQCPVCGKIMYDFGGDHELHISAASLDDARMIYITPEIFGGGNTAFSITVISQYTYQELLNAGLQRFLVFEPVYLDE